MAIDKKRLLEILKECSENTDCESAHCFADEALIEFINDKEIEKAFDSICKWYA